MPKQRIIAFILLLFLFGCSTHPLPEDVTRKSTFDLVQKILCEAKEGIDGEGLSALSLKNTYIGFDFSFDMEEKNNAKNGSFEFLDPFGRGSFSLKLSGGVEKTRKNVRFFRVVESFQTIKDYKDCFVDTARANLIYPIAGKVGVDEVVHTFVRLERLTKLPANANKNGSIFSDALTFTTELSAGATPHLIINSGLGGFKLRNASLDAEASRKDIHGLTIAISAKPKEEAPVLLNRPLLRAAPLVSPENPAAPVIYELERLRNRDEDTQIIERLRPLP
jgi:hypothetical protein